MISGPNYTMIIPFFIWGPCSAMIIQNCLISGPGYVMIIPNFMISGPGDAVIISYFTECMIIPNYFRSWLRHDYLKFSDFVSWKQIF
jgi:hypothetical protein